MNSQIVSQETTEEVVRSFFKDTPMMIRIAQCESHFRQFDDDGSVHRGTINHKDVGVMQINEYYHLVQSKKLGFDIYTLDGNLRYAKWLYVHQGTTPWNWSKKCWSK